MKHIETEHRLIFQNGPRRPSGAPERNEAPDKPESAEQQNQSPEQAAKDNIDRAGRDIERNTESLMQNLARQQGNIEANLERLFGEEKAKEFVSLLNPNQVNSKQTLDAQQLAAREMEKFVNIPVGKQNAGPCPEYGIADNAGQEYMYWRTDGEETAFAYSKTEGLKRLDLRTATWTTVRGARQDLDDLYDKKMPNGGKASALALANRDLERKGLRRGDVTTLPEATFANDENQEVRERYNMLQSLDTGNARQIAAGAAREAGLQGPEKNGDVMGALNNVMNAESREDFDKRFETLYRLLRKMMGYDKPEAVKAPVEGAGDGDKPETKDKKPRKAERIQKDITKTAERIDEVDAKMQEIKNAEPKDEKQKDALKKQLKKLKAKKKELQQQMKELKKGQKDSAKWEKNKDKKKGKDEPKKKKGIAKKTGDKPTKRSPKVARVAKKGEGDPKVATKGVAKKGEGDPKIAKTEPARKSPAPKPTSGKRAAKWKDVRSDTPGDAVATTEPAKAAPGKVPSPITTKRAAKWKDVKGGAPGDAVASTEPSKPAVAPSTEPGKKAAKWRDVKGEAPGDAVASTEAPKKSAPAPKPEPGDAVASTEPAKPAPTAAKPTPAPDATGGFRSVNAEPTIQTASITTTETTDSTDVTEDAEFDPNYPEQRQQAWQEGMDDYFLINKADQWYMMSGPSEEHGYTYKANLMEGAKTTTYEFTYDADAQKWQKISGPDNFSTPADIVATLPETTDQYYLIAKRLGVKPEHEDVFLTGAKLLAERGSSKTRYEYQQNATWYREDQNSRGIIQFDVENGTWLYGEVDEDGGATKFMNVADSERAIAEDVFYALKDKGLVEEKDDENSKEENAPVETENVAEYVPPFAEELAYQRGMVVVNDLVEKKIVEPGTGKYPDKWSNPDGKFYVQYIDGAWQLGSRTDVRKGVVWQNPDDIKGNNIAKNLSLANQATGNGTLLAKNKVEKTRKMS